MNIQETIQDYHERGFNVIPLARDSKTPFAGFNLEKYYQEKYPVDSLLELSKKEKLNLGIVTGKTSNLAVIDVDVHDKVIDYLTQYPTDLVDRTPNKNGSHLYYEYREGLPRGIKIEGGEFYAGLRYVVAPPSTFNGKSYEWLKTGKPGVLPNDLFTRKVDIQSGKYTRPEINNLINTALVSGLVDGQWNDTILYGSIVLAGDGWSKEAIQVFMKNLNKGTNPISEKHLLGMVDRGFEYAQSNKYQKPEVTPNKPQSKEHTIELAVSPYAGMIAKYADYEAHWLIEGWLLESSVIICAAPPERYKTWLSIDLALSVASGLPFLDTYPVQKTGNVLVLQQEDFGARFFARFKNVERAKVDRAKLPIEVTETEQGTIYVSHYDISNKIFFHENAEFTLDNDLAIDRLKQRIIETNALVCIIDPFYSLSVSDDYFATTAAKIRERIKEIRNATGCSFIFIHHTRKSGTTENGDTLNRNQIFGSQFVGAVMEGAWIAGRTKGMGRTQILVARFFKDENAQPTTKITFHINLNAESDTEAYALEIEDSSEEILEEVKTYLTDNGATSYGDLFKIFADRFTSRGAFSRWLGNQVENGIVKGEGKNGKYTIEPTG